MFIGHCILIHLFNTVSTIAHDDESGLPIFFPDVQIVNGHKVCNWFENNPVCPYTVTWINRPANNQSGFLRELDDGNEGPWLEFWFDLCIGQESTGVPYHGPGEGDPIDHDVCI